MKTYTSAVLFSITTLPLEVPMISLLTFVIDLSLAGALTTSLFPIAVGMRCRVPVIPMAQAAACTFATMFALIFVVGCPAAGLAWFLDHVIPA